MLMTGTPTTAGDDIVTDILVVDCGSLSADIRFQGIGGAWFRCIDDVRRPIDFVKLETFDIRGGPGDDVLAGRGNADTSIGPGGNDQINSYLGAGIVNGGARMDRWT